MACTVLRPITFSAFQALREEAWKRAKSLRGNANTRHNHSAKIIACLIDAIKRRRRTEIHHNQRAPYCSTALLHSQSDQRQPRAGFHTAD